VCRSFNRFNESRSCESTYAERIRGYRYALSQGSAKVRIQVSLSARLIVILVDISLIESAVAIGTFTLAGATFWLGWNGRAERKAREQTELAVGAYNPIRAEILNWIDPETAYNDISRDTWTNLKRTQLHLVAQIPKPITSLIDAAEKDVAQARFLRFKIIEMRLGSRILG